MQATNRFKSSHSYPVRARDRMSKRRRLRLCLEQLESRYMLAGDLDNPWAWFQSFDDVPRISVGDLDAEARIDPTSEIGPRDLVASEWIIQLTDESIDSLASIESINALLDRDPVDFTVISGLGSPGSVLLRGRGVSDADVRDVLQTNSSVESLAANALVQGQATPNESEFNSGLLPGLERIDASTAWDESRGSTSIVVGVVDTGIDATHPDLFLNIWLNQGELPAEFLDDDGDKLVDIDLDGMITFYDLNNVTVSPDSPYTLTFGGFASGPNASFVRDLNNNGRIDAIDLLEDANWADGRDTDGNGFFDDFFGVNFRAGADDPFADNNPSDELGHGTHVAGTIGAIGNNDLGVVGVNWRTSLMSLRILDNNNQGDSGAAIRAVNYARAMRERYRTDDDGRVVEGADVRVLNNSWGQPGGFEISLETAISDSYEAGILFVAASGNGNILGNGVDNDRTPFYPASYDVPNVIAVAASDGEDRLASFSNFGAQSVDLLAPGVGVRSTVPRGGYQSANGTSMASPHVAGTAALIWSAFPEATVDEVREAILSPGSVDSVPRGAEIVSSGGRLNAAKAINANVFAPAAQLVAKENITTSGGASTEFTIEYSHRNGIDVNTIDNNDLIVTRQWGPADQLPAAFKIGSAMPSADGKSIMAIYIVDAPGGTWDTLDFGDYLISTVAGEVVTGMGDDSIEARDIGFFNVRIDDDPSVIYVDTLSDSLESGSLRDAIITANAASPAERTIILDSGSYTIDIPAVVDSESTFGMSLEPLGIDNPGGWSNATTGDFDVEGDIMIIGDTNDETVINAQGLDRVFKVHPTASLYLSRLTIHGGVAPATQGGGGILSVGELDLDQVIASENITLVSGESKGGAIAVWGGSASLNESRLTENRADFGGGIYYSGDATGVVQRSTLDHNQGGGLYSFSSGDISVENSTFSANTGGYGAIANGVDDNFLAANRDVDSVSTPMLSADGRFVTFSSPASNLVPGDNNNTSDVFVFDRNTRTIERVNVSDTGMEGEFGGSNPSLSADGQFVTFESFSGNLVPGGNIFELDIFVFDRSTQTIEQVSVSDAGVEGNDDSFGPSLSGDGRYVTFSSNASNLVTGDSNNAQDIFVFDRTLRTTERASVSDAGVEGNGSSSNASLSADGRFVTFESEASNLVPGDNNNVRDIFVFDRTMRTTERVSVSDTGVEGNTRSVNSSLSADGQFVTFESLAGNLVPGDNNNTTDIFVFDRTLRTTERVSVSDAGVGGSGHSENPSLSADGQFVTFESNADNLVPGDNNNVNDIFVFDRTLRTIERVSVSDAGVEGDRLSTKPSLSANGGFVTFRSPATNLVPGDSNFNTRDIFVFDRATRTIVPITYRVPKSVVDVFHATIAFSTDISLGAAVIGDVSVQESLFAENEVNADIDARMASGTNILSTAERSDLIAPLQRIGNLPPVHPLIAGNPAIDLAGSSADGTRDQVGQIRIRSDFGAVEATTASIRGLVYVDRNRNAQLDTDEPGIPDIRVDVTNMTQQFTAISKSDNPQTQLVSEAGIVMIDGLNPDQYRLTVQPGTGWSVSTPPLTIVRNKTLTGNGHSFFPSLSADGRFVAFSSDADNLVLEDNNGTRDIFVQDRTTGTIERVSVSDADVEGNAISNIPSLSDDGRYVAFESDASNLVPGDNNNNRDIFVFDRTTRSIERVSISDAGVEGSSGGTSASLSADGRLVTFESRSSNLVPGDNNNASDVFVFDRSTGTIERVSVSDAGVEGNGGSSAPSLSADGQFVTFNSSSSNLVPGDNNNAADVFVFDRTTRTIERVSVSDAGVEGNGSSGNPSLSADGRYVTFESRADNLVPGDNIGTRDIFVYDRTTQTIERVSVSDAGVGELLVFQNSRNPSLSADGRFVTFNSFDFSLTPGDNNNTNDIFVFDRTTQTIERVSVSDAGVEGRFSSSQPSISADGQFVAFHSDASNLVDGDNNDSSDIFVAFNPLTSPAITQTLQAGEILTGVNLGLVPDPGSISGRVFEDIVLNGIYDQGEPIDLDTTLFLDLNGNGGFDDGEPFTTPDDDGRYEFQVTDSHRSYTVAAQALIGFEQIGPGAGEDFAWNIFLPAGGDVSDRDFAFRRVSSTGQSSASAVSGRLYDDRNGNGVFDPGVDAPIADREVYLDATNFGIRDTNEPRVLTDSEGLYSIPDLSSRTVAVTTTLDEALIHVSPLGSDFTLRKFPLFAGVTPFGNPQAIAVGDFNGDGFQDVMVALGEANTISIRLNDKNGGFLPDTIDTVLGTVGTGPTSLVVGHFDDDPRLDVALTANYSSNVVVLLNFDKDTNRFAPPVSIAVGQEPIDLVAGQFGGDAAIDLVVVNKGASSVSGDETVQVLTNDGSGVFTAGPAIPSGGNDSVSIVAGDFTGDASLDVAVVHAGPLLANTPSGGVTVLSGDGAGGLTLEPSYFEVGALPTDSVSADFDGDGHADLAVANFSSNSISLLLGQADGTFRVQEAILGTASGAFDIAVGDVDNDGDVDVIASNLRDRNISVFRNIGVEEPGGDVRFEPLENIGLGQFSQAQRMPLAVANFDNDSSGPGGIGTFDIVTIPQQTDTLHVLTNRLVNGSYRVALTGTNSITGLDFIIKPALLPPSLDPIENPSPIIEDAESQSLSLGGIAKGRVGGPGLQFVTTSSNSALISDATVNHTDGETTAALTYTPNSDAVGESIITVTVTDAGADGLFDLPDDPTPDDASVSRSFTVSVLPVNDPPTFTVPATKSIQQNAGLQSVASFATGISKGGGNDESNQTLSDFIVTSDESLFTTQPTISRDGNLSFEVRAGVSGAIPVRVELSDGVDVTAVDFTLVVASSSDAIILEGSGNTFFLTQPNSQLDGIQLIDIRGSGDNTLMLDADRIRTAFSGGEIRVISDSGDVVIFDAGWSFEEAFASGDQLVRQFANSGATLNLTGPNDFTNPISVFDVNASGDATALDALQVINELSRRRFSEDSSGSEGRIRDIGTVNLSEFRFYDVSRDARITALDALRVINQLARQSNAGASEGEFIVDNTGIPGADTGVHANSKRDVVVPILYIPPQVFERRDKLADLPANTESKPQPSVRLASPVSGNDAELPADLVDAAFDAWWHDRP